MSTAVTSTQKAFSLRLYRALVVFLRPLAEFILKRRLSQGKEDPKRINERRGIASVQRPEGQLIWLHGASVGESLSLLPLIERLRSLYPHTSYLVTTGTVTSAALMAERLPKSAFHQYIPVDQPYYVGRFFDHWQPDIGLMVESELWPVLLGEAQKRSLPLGLINARLSEKSFRNWSKRSMAAHELLSAFGVILAQHNTYKERFAYLAQRTIICPGNLKRASAPLPADQTGLEDLQAQRAGRPIFLAASTHPGEEELIIRAHQTISADINNLLTIIVPRHPERGDDIEAMLIATGHRVARRSREDVITTENTIYLADTLGELGLFYRLCDVAFIGGSLVPTGGHNPIEPAQLETTIITGPHIFNFQDTFQSMQSADAVLTIQDEEALTKAAIELFTHPAKAEHLARRAKSWADEGGEKVLDETIAALAPLLSALESAS